MNAFVFVGPSLDLDTARSVLDATYLPPVQMGDVYRVVRERPDVICILDGLFERVPAVWHKEILFALSRGVRVVGAASMGALRAAELHTFGMEGVGRIFEAYRDGVLDGDDEVALIHASPEEGYRALSEPLVNVRLGLARAVESHVLDAPLARAAVDAMKARFYAERSWPETYAAMRGAGATPETVERTRAFIAESRPNAKRDDAMEALAYVRDSADRRAPAARDWAFESTELWCQLVATRETSDDETTQRDVRTHALLFMDDAEDLARGALLHALVDDAATRMQIEVSPERTSIAAREFRRARGLESSEMLRRWMKENDLSVEGFASLIEHEARARELERIHRAKLDDGVVSELRRRGDYRPIADQCSATGARERGAESPSLSDLGMDVDGLADWYRRATGRDHWQHRFVHSSDAQMCVLRAHAGDRRRGLR